MVIGFFYKVFPALFISHKVENFQSKKDVICTRLSRSYQIWHDLLQVSSYNFSNDLKGNITKTYRPQLAYVMNRLGLRNKDKYRAIDPSFHRTTLKNALNKIH